MTFVGKLSGSQRQQAIPSAQHKAREIEIVVNRVKCKF
jgi:hypothetical protein